ncbi:MAG: hypothetical protein ACRDIE_22845, partial [Chloroflexota bacterium]
GLMVTYLLISTAAPLRMLFALSSLQPRYVPLIIAALLVWLFLMRLFWRKQLIERYLGLAR